ncbi:hypothetical protein GS966_28820 [Rhodococcus hoagii]|nr:hypothetical protein [Prescottella equi]
MFELAFEVIDPHPKLVLVGPNLADLRVEASVLLVVRLEDLCPRSVLFDSFADWRAARVAIRVPRYVNSAATMGAATPIRAVWYPDIDHPPASAPAAASTVRRVRPRRI